MAVTVKMYPMFRDNYGFLVIDDETGQAALVDPADVAATQKVLAQNDINLTHIWNTHHHPDHAGGNKALLERFPDLTVYAGSFDQNRIPGVTAGLEDGAVFSFGASEVKVNAVPGHTDGHITYYTGGKLFCGDTIFVAGCGRLFEGTARELYTSISKLKELPDDTLVYCAHEYTLSNMAFALSVDGDNPELKAAYAEAKSRRERGEFTVPTTIGREKATNPFMRSGEQAIKNNIGLPNKAPAAEAFAKLREMKDTF